MRSISQPDIFAAGDAAQPVEEPGVPMRMSAFTAVVTGSHAADCLSDVLHGKTPQPLSFAYPGMCIALGQHEAIAFNIYPADEVLKSLRSSANKKLPAANCSAGQRNTSANIARASNPHLENTANYSINS
jgi:NADH dehydrogenase FAD-containing subunit